jgi:tripartite-type tricarboxylate transporter receptor subunit TctC
MLRRCCAALVGIAGMSFISHVAAQAYPAKPVRVIVNYTPGGPTDLTARTVGGKMQEITGQPFIIENTPSANGVVGTQNMMRSAPDGYTLMLSTAGHTSLGKALYEDKLPFDPFRDLAPISMTVTSNQLILAHPALGVKTIAELVKLAKARPGQLNYASPGIGTPNQLGMELFKIVTGTDIVHVPYKGTAPMMQDMLAGRVQVLINGAATVLPHIRSGKLVPLASGWTTRARAVPDVPTMEELGYKGYQVSTWFALFAPVKTPAPVIARLNALATQALADPQVIKTLDGAGFETAGSTPEYVTKLMREEYERWKKVIADAKIVPE